MILIIVFAFFALIILFWQISLIIALIGGAPTIYAKKNLIIKAFESSNLKKNQLVIDLGCGNARSLIIAAKDFGARGIGIEISPFSFLMAKINVAFCGETKNIKIRFGNFKNHKKDLQSADLIFLYLFDKIIIDIEPWIFENINQKAKVASLAFPFKDHKGIRRGSKPPIYLYT